MELSNKSLALLLVSAIVISLGGTIISLNKINNEGLTGMVAGNVSVSITTAANCVIDSNVTFGSGIPTGTALLSTNATAPTGFSNDCTSNAACRGMMINNTGNVNLNVTFKTDVNGTTLLGGPGASNDDFQYMQVNGTYESPALQGGCVAGNRTYWGNANETETTICSNFTYPDTIDMMTLEFNITVDQNTPAGTKTALVTIACAQN